MPTGTRNRVSANNATTPRIATGAVLMPFSLGARDLGVVHLFRMKDQSVSTNRDQKHRRDVAGPRDREERPGRHVHIECRDIVVIGAAHLVEQRPRLHRHHEQQNQSRKHIDQALVFRADIAPDQIDGDVGAAIAGGGNTPEDQNAQQQTPDIEGIRDRIAEKIAQQNRDENVEGDNADKSGRNPFDRVDETIHGCALHFRSTRPSGLRGESTAAEAAVPTGRASYCVNALYLASEARSSANAASGSIPVFLTLSPQVLISGSDAFFHNAVCSGVSVYTSWPDSAFTLSRPASSNLPQGSPTRPAASVLQLSSIAFFCRSDIWLYLSLFMTKANVVT